jgi:hypothetical protein
MVMDVKTKTTLKYLMETCKTSVDLKWKMNKFIENGDVSFLGNNIKQLNERISWAESIAKVNECDMIVGITRSEPTEGCETRIKLMKNTFKPEKDV